jgi:hypothetical protein
VGCLRFAQTHRHSPLVALAQLQGIKAGRKPATTPLDCPWPPDMYEEVYGWLTGYAMTRLSHTASAGNNNTRRC